MLDVQFESEEYEFSNIEEKDIEYVSQWIKENNEDGTCYSLDSQIFYRRFLEYYVTENEIFIKVKKDEKIVGVFKGRLELDKRKELFIWLFIIDKELRSAGIGTEIIEIIIDYFKEKFHVNSIDVGVSEDNHDGIAFWNMRNFEYLRNVQDFFENNEEEKCDLVIMERNI